jgi:hypothetical protein
MAGYSSTPGLSKQDRLIIQSWPVSNHTVCGRCGGQARVSKDADHPQWACLPCKVVVYSMTPAFRDKKYPNAA